MVRLDPDNIDYLVFDAWIGRRPSVSGGRCWNTNPPICGSWSRNGQTVMQTFVLVIGQSALMNSSADWKWIQQTMDFSSVGFAFICHVVLEEIGSQTVESLRMSQDGWKRLLNLQIIVFVCVCVVFVVVVFYQKLSFVFLRCLPIQQNYLWKVLD